MSSAPTNPSEQSASNSVTEERDDGTPAVGDRAVEGQSADSSDLTADPASAQSASSDLPADITKDVAHDAGTSTGVGGDQPQLDSVANDAGTPAGAKSHSTSDLQPPEQRTNESPPQPRRFRRVTGLAAGLAVGVAVTAVGTYFVANRLPIGSRRGPLTEMASSTVASPANSPAHPSNSAGASAIVGPRVALVIGNSSYRYVPQLANPRNDARLIARNLRDVGFNLVGGDAQLDLDKPGLERALEEFSRQLQGTSVALFYYAGHGLQLSGENYLVPTSADPERESDVKLQMVDAQVILDQMQDAGARLNILILDACRNNPFGGRGLRAVAGGLAPMQAPEGTLIAYATQPGAVAGDGKGADSPYTTALSQVMREPGVEFRDAFNQVGLTVTKETAGSQQPWTANSPIDGHFYFAAAPSPVSTPAPAIALSAQPGEDAEILFWHSIESSKDPRDFDAYLKQYPSGRFSALAAARVSEFSAPKPAPITPRVKPEVAPQDSEKHLALNHPSQLLNPSPSVPSRRHQQLASIETPVARALPNTQLSHSLSEYLHHNRLPYVDALVLSDQTGEPSSVVLSGRVRTERGQRDAESKARDYLDAPDLSIRNRIALDSTLAVNRVGGSPSTTQTLSESPERTIAASSCVEQCDQIYSSCSSACQAQNAGSSIAQVGSVAASLLGGYAGGATALAPTVLQGDYQVCANRCEESKNTCAQLCDLKSGR